MRRSPPTPRCPWRPRPLLLLLCLGLLWVSACKPSTGGGDDTAMDLALRAVDLSSCPAAEGEGGDLLKNGSFEGGAPGGGANNTGAPASSIERWDGCCNLDGQGLTTTWRVSTSAGGDGPAARCGAAALSLRSTGARGDVLNQTLTLSDGAGRAFVLTGWARLQSASPGAELTLDLFDLVGDRVLVAAPPLTAASAGGAAGAEWIQLTAVGKLPGEGGGPAPRVQVRVLSRGTLTALCDDVSLILR